MIRLAVVRRKGGTTADVLKTFRLPPGLLNESFGEPNLSDPDDFSKILGNAIKSCGVNSRKVKVALPDFTFRVFVLDFDTLPKKADETAAVINLRLRKLVPFDIGEATVRHQYLGAHKGENTTKHRFLVTLINGMVLKQYEKCFAGAGLRPTHIGVSSLLVWNLYHDIIKKEVGERRSYALMMVSGRRISVLVLEKGTPRFFRLKDLGLQENAGAGDVPEPLSIMRELGASLTFYKENFSTTPVELVYTSCSNGILSGIREALGENPPLNLRPLSLENALSIPVKAGVDKDELYEFNAVCAAAMES